MRPLIYLYIYMYIIVYWVVGLLHQPTNVFDALATLARWMDLYLYLSEGRWTEDQFLWSRHAHAAFVSLERWEVTGGDTMEISWEKRPGNRITSWETPLGLFEHSPNIWMCNHHFPYEMSIIGGICTPFQEPKIFPPVFLLRHVFPVFRGERLGAMGIYFLYQRESQGATKSFPTTSWKWQNKSCRMYLYRGHYMT